MGEPQRYVVTWRKTGEDVLDWGHTVTDNRSDTERVVARLIEQGVHQYHTYPIGEMVAELSSAY